MMREREKNTYPKTSSPYRHVTFNSIISLWHATLKDLLLPPPPPRPHPKNREQQELLPMKISLPCNDFCEREREREGLFRFCLPHSITSHDDSIIIYFSYC
jgi:hypothetical protein